ncbi:MAG: ABC transporter permease, partial [Chloroflexota bacterium]|nr:ABC transporter permease [Chloroflexota bacterium]
MNVLGVPPVAGGGFGDLHAVADGARLALDALAPDEVYANTEAAAALSVGQGDRIRVYMPSPESEHVWRVRAVTRLGDLGGGQATIFLPLDRLQRTLGREDQVNQIVVINRGDAAARLASSWPVTVALRAALLDDQTSRRLHRAMSSPPAREVLGRALASSDTPPRLAEKLRQLRQALEGQPTAAEFKALAQDPEVLARLASRLPDIVNRGNTPFAAGLAGARNEFRVIDVQGVAQDQADRWGSAFTDLFVVLGAFSLFSGMLLIVLVFSLVALERRAELGISRALGARRRDVVLLLAIEGGLYSLLSSLFGLAGGLALALSIVRLAQDLVEQYGFHLEPVVEPRSLLVSYGLGVVLTFAAVTATAWRSSRFSIATAIRDLPDPPAPLPGWRALVASAGVATLGVVSIAVGVLSRLSLVYATGVAVVIVGVALVARWALRRGGLRGPERVVFTLAGLALIGWWTLPLGVFPAVVEMSFLSGVAMLLGAVWVTAYNIGLLRGFRARAPLWRLSTAYVAANRFRTGLTLTMFALVVLSLTLSAVMLTATREAYPRPEAVTGGWDIRVDSSAPPGDLRAVLDERGTVPSSAFEAIGLAAPLRLEAIQVDADAARWQPVTAMVVDDEFARAGRTPLVGGDVSAWSALTRPGTAVVGAGLLSEVPNRLRVQAHEGAGFRPVVLWLRDLRGTRAAVRVTVVGLADAGGPFGNAVMIGKASIAGWPPPDRANYFLAVPPGSNARELAAGLGLSADLTARTIGDEVRLVQGVRGLLGMILQGFMGTGLLAGVAALGTLSTRAVVERRRQIGVLRALGLSSRAVAAGLLVESGVIALVGAGLGVGIGLFVANSTLLFLRRQNPELRFGIPWEQLLVVVLVALGAALLMTALPARRAGRLTAGEALREV